MTAIRNLAREASGYGEPAPPAVGATDRGPSTDRAPSASPVKMEALSPLPHSATPEPPFPFTPTHVLDDHVIAEDGGSWEPFHEEFMVLGNRVFTRPTWEGGMSPDLLIDDDGHWYHETGGHVFDAEGAPVPLLWMDGLGPDGRPQQWLDTHPLPPELLCEPENSTVEGPPTSDVDVRAGDPDRMAGDPELDATAHEPGSWGRPWSDELEEQLETERDERLLGAAAFRQVVADDRLDRLEARREDEWAARERAAEALDRLYTSDHDDGAMESE